jgi:hypothetical protein
MPPRTNAKKAKARAKAKAKVQAEADENKPSFDVDESVAAAVLEKVTSTRDRLALACVSQVWKNAVTSEGAWGTCDLVLDGELGERLTDERFERLLCYCGDIKHLEVRDAPLSFVGNFLSGEADSDDESETEDEARRREGIAAKFASLESFKLTNCPGVNVSDVGEFMSLIGMEARPEEKRLRCLRLAGCRVCHPGYWDISTLQECLAISQEEVFRKPVESDGFVLEGIYEQVQFLNLAKHRSSFDLWRCDGYEDDNCYGYTTTPEMKICENCTEVFCPICVAEREGTSCDTCDYFVCGGCEDTENQLIFCDGSDCDKVYCQMCYFSGGNEICRGSPGDDPDDMKCFKSYCKDCAEEERINFVYCPECHGCWCTGKCVGTLNVCFGKGGCYKTMCIPCMKKKGRFFPFCHDCQSSWCPDCDPRREVCRPRLRGPLPFLLRLTRASKARARAPRRFHASYIIRHERTN